MSAEQVGQAIGCSQSKISKIENLRTMPTTEDVRSIASACGASESEIARLLALFAEMRSSRSRCATTRSVDADTQVAAYEEAASDIVAYSPQLIPGILQHPLYTEAILDRLEKLHRNIELTGPLNVRSLLGGRIMRQRNLKGRRTFNFFISAKCFEPSPVWCSAALMRMQIDYIDSILRMNPQVKIWLCSTVIDSIVVPALEEFSIFDEDRAVIVESYVGTQYIEDPEIVSRYLDALKVVRDCSEAAQVADGRISSQAELMRNSKLDLTRS
jgi:transcriptional regulator with XRE-family HTH domain